MSRRFPYDQGDNNRYFTSIPYRNAHGNPGFGTSEIQVELATDGGMQGKKWVNLGLVGSGGDFVFISVHDTGPLDDLITTLEFMRAQIRGEL